MLFRNLRGRDSRQHFQKSRDRAKIFSDISERNNDYSEPPRLQKGVSSGGGGGSVFRFKFVHPY